MKQETGRFGWILLKGLHNEKDFEDGGWRHCRLFVD